MKIGIAVFSGTGNTAYVAGLLSKELEKLGATVEVHRIDHSSFRADKTDMTVFNPEDYDLTGIAHPVSGFGASPLVLRFANALPAGTGRMFVFKSAADIVRLNSSASEELIGILEGKGYKVFHDFLYLMPCNWAVTYNRQFNLQMIDTAAVKAARHAKEITLGVKSLMPTYPAWRRLARWIHRLEVTRGMPQFSKALKATAACTLCGKCVSDCPVGNIRKERHTILFGGDCIWCMRCVYACPAKAINAGLLSWCIVKGGYRLPEYLNAPDKIRLFITDKSRGYWKRFREYFMNTPNHRGEFLDRTDN